TIFGITEPTVYGVTLPLKKPFIAPCIGAGIGGAFVAMNHVKNFTFGLVSMLCLPGFIPAETKDTAPLITGAIGARIALII
ncbi:PTS beta-glucoside transporter subunit EIIBCA, partial [Enterococcus faecalis]